MNAKEMMTLLTKLKASYPLMASKLTQNELKVMCGAWLEVFQNRSFDEVLVAVNTYIRTNDTGFAPAIGQINAMLPDESGIDSPAEAWDRLLRVLALDDTSVADAFNKLPLAYRKAAGGLSTIYSWKKISTDRLETSMRRQFMQDYAREIGRSTSEPSQMAIEGTVTPTQQPKDWRYKAWKDMTPEEHRNFKALPPRVIYTILSGTETPSIGAV